MVDTVITLGNFQFRDYEVPEYINFGGEQRLSVKELVGGTRIIDAMGPSDTDPTWSGLIMGTDAMQRALQLDAMRVAGQTLTFSIFSLSYQVIIANFVFKTERYYQIRYEITLKIVTDYNTVNINNNVTNFTGQINNDLSTVNSLGSSINDPTLNADLLNITTTFSDIPSVDQAPPDQVNDATDDLQKGLADTENYITKQAQTIFGSDSGS